MILKKYFIFGIVCLLILKVKSENVTINQMETEEVNTDTGKVNMTTESINVTQEPIIEMDEQESSELLNQPMKVMELNLNDEDKVMLQNLNGIIEKLTDETAQTEGATREGKSLKDENFKRAAEALTDEEITEIIKSISFPNEDDINEDTENLKRATDAEVEPRTGRALRSHGYYIIAFTPIEEEQPASNTHETLPYTRLQILPAERSVDGDVYENPRFISKKAWNKYIRRIMRQIRKGTRKIQRKTKIKSLKEEPTVENFLKRMYKLSQKKSLRQQQTKKKSSWFIW